MNASETQRQPAAEDLSCLHIGQAPKRTNSQVQTALVHNLMGALRQELQEYGEMLALLDFQNISTADRKAEDVLKSVFPMHEQLQRIQAVRRHREACQCEVAQVLAPPACRAASFEKLIPLLPDQFRVAVEILVRENNHLLLRIQHRTRQNHLSLSRSLDMVQQFVDALAPTDGPAPANGEDQAKMANAITKLL